VPTARKVIGAVLRPKGYEVIEAANALEATESGRSVPRLDLLVADILLPDRSGVHVAVDLAAIHPEMAVLFVSGTPIEGWRAPDLVEVQKLRTNSWVFLLKPFQASALDECVRGLLARQSRLRSEPLAEAMAAGGGVNSETVGPVLQAGEESGNTMTHPGILHYPPNPSRFPGICQERVRLSDELLSAIRELTELHSQQTRAVIESDPEFARFDDLIHFANERKEEAKYALMRHIGRHQCEEV
jgi:CheY-like chemotaxis protein